jgi:hypothetical protein
VSSIDESLCLKFGTVKSWTLDPDGNAAPIMAEYIARFCGVQGQIRSPEQQEMLCKLIDSLSTEDIVGDWDGKIMSKDDAKNYVINYQKKETAPIRGM